MKRTLDSIRLVIATLLMLVLFVPAWGVALLAWIFDCAYELIIAFRYWKKPKFRRIEDIL